MPTDLNRVISPSARAYPPARTSSARSVTEAASGRVNGGAAKRKEWLDELRAAEQTAIEKRLPSLKSDASPIHPYRLVSEINDFLTADSI